MKTALQKQLNRNPRGLERTEGGAVEMQDEATLHYRVSRLLLLLVVCPLFLSMNLKLLTP